MISTILAQSDALQLDDDTASLLFSITILLFILLIVGFVLAAVMKQTRRSREMLHEERLRAIDSGLNWQDPEQKEQQDKILNTAFWISFWMIVVGCGASFSAVSSFLGNGSDHDTNVAMVAWLSAGVSSVAALTCATTLTVKARVKSENLK